MYMLLDEIKSIQLDHTSRCNLMCPQCARVSDNKLNPKMPIKDLTLDDYKIIFEPFIGKNINILHCGNYGDVIASPTFNETLDWCLDKGFNNIRIITNGSARSTAWWKDLGEKKVNVAFSIDGLADTNPLYRVNSNFDKIIDNVRAFTGAGGNARWDYLVFKHNDHQIELAKTLAKELGVKEFNTKNTTRFITPAGYNNIIANKKEKNVVDRDDNPILKDYQTAVKTFGSFEEYTRVTPITCKTKVEKRIYVDFDTRLWPCCWTGAPIYFPSNNDVQAKDIKKLLDKYGNDFNRLDLQGWDVLNHEFFASYLEHTWNNSQDRIYTCGRTCGQGYEFSSAYGNNQDIKKI